MESSKYLNREMLIADEFSKIEYANKVLVKTIVKNEKNIDLNPAKNRVKFDIEEIDKLLKDEIKENHDEIIFYCKKIEKNSLLIQELKKSFENIQISYSKIKQEILNPYNEAEPLINKLKILQNILSNLRSLTWYLNLLKQLEILQLSILKNNANSSKSSIKSAVLTYEIKQYLNTNPSLKQLNIVKNSNSFFKEIENSIIVKSTSFIASYQTNSKNIYEEQLNLISFAITLYLLSPDLLLDSIRQFLATQSNNASIVLYKGISGSLATFEKSTNEIRPIITNIVSFTRSLSQAYPPLISTKQNSNSNSNSTSISNSTPAKYEFSYPNDKSPLINYVLKRLQIDSIVLNFWKDVIKNLDRKSRDFFGRNNSNARLLRKNLISMKEIMTDCILSPGLTEPNGPEVNLMLNYLEKITK